MPFTDRRKTWVWAPLLVSIVLLVGFGLGVLSQKYLGKSKPLTKFLTREDPIDEIITLIDNEYVDSVNKDSLYLDAVNGIMRNLDPHTVYIPSSELAKANELLEGSGKGIGVEYYYYKDTLMVTNVNPLSPADKAGIKIGDKLIRVDGQLIAGNEITEQSATDLIRFSKTDTLNFIVLPAGDKKLKKVILVKDNIKYNSVYASYLLNDNTTGYIKLGIFSASSYDDFTHALQLLINKGLKHLILDLRGNNGGYLEEAVAIADEFLDGDKLIVYTKGKNRGKYNYEAGVDGVFEKGKLIILIDENSASASEILAGAIQDWDRGVILGSTSFGKGLVQEQFELSDGSAVRITIARYFTPSGRSIQRPYNNGIEAYNDAYYERVNELKNGVNLPNTDNTAENIFYSLIHKRKLKGHGGITPDIFGITSVRPQSSDLMQFVKEDYINQFVNSHYIDYFKKNINFTRLDDFINDFEINNDEIEMARQFFQVRDAISTRTIWANKSDLSYIRIMIKARLAYINFGKEAYYKVINQYDDEIAQAMSILHTPLYFQILSKDNTQPVP